MIEAAAAIIITAVITAALVAALGCLWVLVSIWRINGRDE